MSWLFKSLQSDQHDAQTQGSQNNGNGGVKDDLSVIGQTIGRQLRGVAAFLAPPPVTEQQSKTPTESQTYDSSPSSQRLQGIRNDLVEIGGSFKSGLSLLSSNKAVTGFSKLASNLLQFQNQDDDFDGVPGITEDVLQFVKEIALRSECWTDFPLSVDDDFEMSDAQREHATAVEHLVPSFSDLRINLRPHLEDDKFWMIYFILLLPRLNEQDLELLSTPKIIETRNILLQKLQNKKNVQVEKSNTSDVSSKEGSKVCETQGGNVSSGEKDVTEIVNATDGIEIDEEENTQWFEESDVDTSMSVNTQKHIQHEEDVSFSDLEDDSNDLHGRLSAHRPARDTKASSPSGSSDWIQLNDSSVNRGDLEKARQSTTSRDKDSEGESSDWLTVDDYD